MNENMFEYATRNQLRFPFKGMISVEDLWQLSLQDLDSVYKSLSKELKSVNEESLLADNTEKNEEVAIKIDIVIYIFETKKREAEDRKNEAERREKKQKILEAIDQKLNAELNSKSVSELQEMLKDL